MRCDKCKKEFVAPNEGVNNQNKYNKEQICFRCYVERLGKNVGKKKEKRYEY